MGPNVSGITNRSNNYNSIDDTLDKTWLKNSFMLADRDIDNSDDYMKWIKKNKYISTADLKFSCTSPGMNISVNAKPQFTRYADIRVPGKLKSGREEIYSVTTTPGKFGLGMGRYYSEAIDDNEQRIYMRFGVASYQPLLVWAYRSFSVDKAILQNRGVITRTLLDAVNIVSSFFAITSAPLLAAGMFMADVFVENSRFVSLKDTMYLYWSTVENIMNSIVARRTMVPYLFTDYTYKIKNTMNKEQRVSSEFIQGLSEFIPDVVDAETGRISVYAIALRYQAASNRILKEDYEKNKNQSLSSNFTGYQETESKTHDTYFTNNSGGPNTQSSVIIFAHKLLKLRFEETVKDVIDVNGSVESKDLVEFNQYAVDEKGNPIDVTSDGNNTLEEKIKSNIEKKQNIWSSYKEYLLAELTDGAAFAVFNVETTGSVGESFSNSFATNPLEGMFNSISAKARNLGNIFSSAAASIPGLGEVLGFAGDATATVLSNATFGIANPLLALAYGVNITMPKIWENSVASLPRANYKIKLVSPYGNAYSQLFNIYLPLSMILAGSLPRSTGNASYTHPFFCQLFDRGRVMTKLGMVEQVSVTRGTSNLAFSRNGHPNAIDVDISIANLDEYITVDVTDSGILSTALKSVNPRGLFVDTPFQDYINTIAGVDVHTMIYRIPMARIKLAERYMAIKAVMNPDPAAFAMSTVDKIPFEGIMKQLLSSNRRAIDDLTQR